MATAFKSVLINQNLAHLDRTERLAFTGAKKAIGIVLKDGFSLSALSRVTNTLRLANGLCSSDIFDIHLIAQKSSVTSDVGMIISTNMLMADLNLNGLDCLLVCGADSAHFSLDSDLKFKLRQAAGLGVLIGGLASGCQALLEAGLLDNQQCTASQNSIDCWQHTFKKVEFRSIPYLVDGPRMSCSSPYAVVAMMVEFVGIQCNAEIAEAIRQGLPQSTYLSDNDSSSIPSFTLPNAPRPIKETIMMMSANIENPLDITALAEGAGVSRRHLERLFNKHLNASPTRFYLELRLTHARQLLMHTSKSLTEISIASGFLTFSHFYSRFKETFGYSPNHFRGNANAIPRRFGLI
ncbi:helix-turn-helix domain-containing protein [Pantoea sp. Ap-967]|uniref:GlxA family transcriptional regulator n=1 Tax=Pantoea sp. Ap-967 TaxID=2608362 RepID=UPI001423257F|nr:helix-turn-helix domain-containing protein [Pantoea sp. Ap-967]NIE75899.1 helix-turn-helix domain-containing protein [Pantoea sp. Ap-967]